MSRTLFGCVIAGTLALTVTLAAQNPAPTSSAPAAAPAAAQTPAPAAQTPAPAARPAAPASQAAAPSAAKTVTVEGCLMKEADVPGFKPNPVERAGIAEDYILTSTKMVTGTAPAIAAAQAKPGDSPVGTSGTQGTLMYDVEGISDAQLKEHVGRRVQIDGTFDNISSAKAGSPTTASDLVEIRGTVIRQAAGDCAAK